MERKTFSQLPLGVSDFHKLRELEKIYVDKTGLLYELITTFEKVFLARPRRFGKSLLVSTFESLFKYGTRDFKGLAIEKLWKDKTYKVIRLDFSNLKDFSSEEEFSVLLDEYFEILMAQSEVTVIWKLYKPVHCFSVRSSMRLNGEIRSQHAPHLKSCRKRYGLMISNRRNDHPVLLSPETEAFLYGSPYSLDGRVCLTQQPSQHVRGTRNAST